MSKDNKFSVQEVKYGLMRASAAVQANSDDIERMKKEFDEILTQVVNHSVHLEKELEGANLRIEVLEHEVHQLQVMLGEPGAEA